MLMTILSLVLTMLIVTSFSGSNQVYPITFNQCSMENCSRPTVIDPNLKVELVTSGLNAPTNMVVVDDHVKLVLERYNGKNKKNN